MACLHFASYRIEKNNILNHLNAIKLDDIRKEGNDNQRTFKEVNNRNSHSSSVSHDKGRDNEVKVRF